MPYATLFGDFIPDKLPVDKPREFNWYEILHAYKRQDAKDMVSMAAMLPAVHSMPKEEYQNLLEVTARALVINVTTKQSLLVGLVWFIQFCPQQEYLEPSCLVGLLRLFIAELKKAPELMRCGNMPAESLAGFSLIAELLIVRREYEFDFMSSPLKAELKEVRIQLKSNIRSKLYAKQYLPKVEYLDELLGQLCIEGQEHINFKPGGDKLAYIVLSTAAAILGIVVGMACASTPFGWAVAVTVVGSLALSAGLIQQCRDFYIHYRAMVNEPRRRGIKLGKFEQYRLVNNIVALLASQLQTEAAVGDKDNLTWEEILELLSGALLQYPELHQYCASVIIDLIYAFPPGTISDSMPLTTFILDKIANNKGQRYVWFSLHCHLHHQNSALFTRDALNDLIAERKHKEDYRAYCDEEIKRIEDLKRDQRLWDLRKLRPEKIADVRRVQQRWLDYKPHYRQLFDTGVLNLLPSHHSTPNQTLVTQINHAAKQQPKPILLVGPSGCGKSVLAGYCANTFQGITRLFTFAYLPPAEGKGLSIAAITQHYFEQITKQYVLWARDLAREYARPIIESNLRDAANVVAEVRRLLGITAKPWCLIVDDIPEPGYWHDYHQQCGEKLLNFRGKNYILLTSQTQCQSDAAKDSCSTITIATEKYPADAKELLTAIHPMQGDAIEETAVQQLIEQTKALPAALAMAAVFIKFQKESGSVGRVMTYKEYWRKIVNYSTMLEKQLDKKSIQPYTIAVVAIVKYSIGAVDQKAKRDPVNSLMDFLCSIAKSPVTYQIIYQYWHHQKSISKAPIELDEIITMAERLNLLRRVKIINMVQDSLVQDSFVVPKFVYHVWSASLKNISPVAKLTYLESLIVDPNSFKNRDKNLNDRFILPHVTQLLGSMTSPMDAQELRTHIIATYGAADTARYWGNNSEAARLFERGLALLEQARQSGQQNLTKYRDGQFHDGLAIVKKLQGQPKIALQHGEKALLDFNHVNGQDKDKGNHYFSLGNIYLDVGAYKRAKKMFNHALKYRVSACGQESGEAANSLSGLGLLLSTLNQFSEALSAHDKAIEINQQQPGHARSKWSATSYHDKAVCLTALGNYSEAVSLHKEALELRKIYLDNDHYQVTTSHNSLGCSYYFWGESLTAKNDAVAAKETFRLALEQHEYALRNDVVKHGEQHLYTLISILNKARVVAAINANDPLAVSLLTKAKVTLDATEIPSDNPHVLSVLWHIVKAKCCLALGELPNAEKYYRDALQLSIAIYGKINLQTAEIYWHLLQIPSIAIAERAQYKKNFTTILTSIEDVHDDHWLKVVLRKQS